MDMNQMNKLSKNHYINYEIYQTKINKKLIDVVKLYQLAFICDFWFHGSCYYNECNGH